MMLIQALVVALSVVSVTSKGECIQGVNCFLPDCFCPTFNHPMGTKIPQIIYFGFDDAVTPQVGQYFDRLFTEELKNPNDCPITMSLYVCHDYTIYSLVSEYFSYLDEIGVHSVTHTFIKTAEKLRVEATNQKRNIEIEANIPGKDIIGWRSPDLITAGDDQPRILKELNFTYDISLPYETDEKVAFPFTLDYGYPYPCSVLPCPGKDSVHKGFWEVPINTMFDPVSKIPCTYVDSCRPFSEEAAYEFLMYNFLRSYDHGRAPFGLNMHAAWFYFPMYLNAMERFIKTIVRDYPDTYIVSVKQMMAWMKNPQNIDQSRTFQPWGCPVWKAKKAQQAREAADQNKSNEKKPEDPAPSTKSSEQKPGDLSQFVDPRLSLSARQKWSLKHNVQENLIPKKSNKANKKTTENLSQFVDPKLSLSARQNWFLRHLVSKSSFPKKSHKKNSLKASLLFRSMQKSN